MRNLANSVALKILSISRAIERHATIRPEPPAPELPAIMPEPVADVQPPVQGQGELPPLSETPLDQGMVLQGADSFDALLGGNQNA